MHIEFYCIFKQSNNYKKYENYKIYSLNNNYIKNIEKKYIHFVIYLNFDSKKYIL
jgi:hypothetical protein